MAVIILDLGSGNLRSVERAMRETMPKGSTTEIIISADPDRLRHAERIILPGQGAFGACMAGLNRHDGMREALTEAVFSRGVPMLGICVGMQLLVERGLEHGEHLGLGWLQGRCVPIAAPPPLKIPHMGWNDLSLSDTGAAHPLLRGIDNGDHAYFVHSYGLQGVTAAATLASCDYGGEIVAMVGGERFAGTQFHAEKSQQTGLKILTNFWQW